MTHNTHLNAGLCSEWTGHAGEAWGPTWQRREPAHLQAHVTHQGQREESPALFLKFNSVRSLHAHSLESPVVKGCGAHSAPIPLPKTSLHPFSSCCSHLMTEFTSVHFLL